MLNPSLENLPSKNEHYGHKQRDQDQRSYDSAYGHAGVAPTQTQRIAATKRGALRGVLVSGVMGTIRLLRVHYALFSRL